ncbi:MAG TPA: ABC transporter ATP-binding protein [Anaerolineaceae bacterium]
MPIQPSRIEVNLQLSVHSLSVRYGSRLALHQVSFELGAGEILGVIGPNGAGKSTLIRAVSGTVPAAEGSVLLDGADAARMTNAERAKRMAVVPQAQNLPPAFTAWETVLLGRTPHLDWLGNLSPADEQAALTAMERTDTLSLAGRPMGELSGGEAQRVLLARAITQSAPILLLDEPTAHLDLQYQVGLLGLVSDLVHQGDLSALLALHDLNLVARYADRVALLSRGELLRLGTPREVLDPAFLSLVYRVPLQAVPAGSADTPLIFPSSG